MDYAEEAKPFLNTNNDIDQLQACYKNSYYIIRQDD